MALKYTIAFAPPGAPDVVTRRFGVQLNGGETTTEELPVGQADKELVVLQGTHVKLSLADVDDAGNVSPPAENEFDALDTLAPPMPGPMTVTLVEEVPDP